MASATYTTGATYTTNATTSLVWEEWNSEVTSSTTVDSVWASWAGGEVRRYQPVVYSEAQTYIAPSREEIERDHRRRELLRFQEEEANNRAKELLLSMLDESQKNDLNMFNHFRIKGKKHEYRIRKANSYNVDRLDEHGQGVERLCAVPSLPVPTYDAMLAQKLYIENDEDGFLKVANHSVSNH